MSFCLVMLPDLIFTDSLLSFSKIFSRIPERGFGTKGSLHPRFHAYFPSGNSYPAILGDMLSDIIGCIGFSWAASPALTELETIVLDWLGKAIGLPNEFLAFAEGSTGGGVIQTSASECVLVTMLAARAQALKRLKKQHPFVEEGVLLSKLMAYCSKEAHSCVEKAAMISFVKLRILEPDDKCSLRGATLRQKSPMYKECVDVFIYNNKPSVNSQSITVDVPISDECRHVIH
ncbi:Tyrosine decarboxylase [Homalodisca vitripennis]|nr:Tyrosine decarboxylase [Homalodisca vitripennis]